MFVVHDFGCVCVDTPCFSWLYEYLESFQRNFVRRETWIGVPFFNGVTEFLCCYLEVPT